MSPAGIRTETPLLSSPLRLTVRAVPGDCRGVGRACRPAGPVGPPGATGPARADGSDRRNRRNGRDRPCRSGGCNRRDRPDRFDGRDWPRRSSGCNRRDRSGTASRPTGATGATGAIGPAGPAGATGAIDPARPAGPDRRNWRNRCDWPRRSGGCSRASRADRRDWTGGCNGASRPGGQRGATLVAGTPVTSAANAPVNTTVTATASCSAGHVALGGGALVTTTAAQKSRAILTASYPSAAATWTAVGVSNAALGAGNHHDGDRLRAVQPIGPPATVASHSLANTSRQSAYWSPQECKRDSVSPSEARC